MVRGLVNGYPGTAYRQLDGAALVPAHQRQARVLILQDVACASPDPPALSIECLGVIQIFAKAALAASVCRNGPRFGLLSRFLRNDATVLSYHPNPPHHSPDFVLDNAHPPLLVFPAQLRRTCGQSSLCGTRNTGRTPCET